MSRTRIVVLSAGLVGATVVAYAVSLVVTAFVACGISGCGGGGFGPSYSPGQTQVGLVVCGLVLVPIVMLVLRRQPWPWRAGTALAAVAGGALLAMALLGLGPDGCPADRTRTTAGPTAFEAGAATCSDDRDVAA